MIILLLILCVIFINIIAGCPNVTGEAVPTQATVSTTEQISSERDGTYIQ